MRVSPRRSMLAPDTTPDMRVMAVFHYADFGGPHNQVLRLAGPLAEQGVEMLVAQPPGSASARLRSGGVSVEEVVIGRLRSVKDVGAHLRLACRYPRDVWRLVSVFRRYRPDVVLLSSSVNFQAALAARLLGIPVVWQLVDMFPPKIVRRLVMYPIRFLADVVMPIGEAIAAAHPGMERVKKRVTYYSPVDTEVFRPLGTRKDVLREELGIPVNSPIVGMVSNVNPGKGYEVFIDAAATILRDRPETRFVIIGTVNEHHLDYYESLRKRAADHGLIVGENLFFMGSRSDVESLTPSIDVVLFTSLSEGTPTSVLEAMASGVSVISSDVGTVREVIVDGESGYIVPSGDWVWSAEICKQLLADPEARAQLGANARARIESHFSLDHCASNWVRAFTLATEPRLDRK